MYLYQITRFKTFINNKSSDRNEINTRNLYKKKTCALAFMPPQEVSKLWVMIMDEYRHIENIEGFYDYITNTWRHYLVLYDGIIVILEV